MLDRVENLVAKAQHAMQSGDRNSAINAWKAVVDADPNHPVGLNMVGNWHLSQGNATLAQNFLAQAVAADPGQPALLFNLAAAARAANDRQSALNALQQALAVDPYFVQAMFQMAILYEEAGQTRSAAQVYRNFIDTAPPEILADPRFAETISRAKTAVARDNDALETAVLDTSEPPSARAKEAADALFGKGKIYVAEPTFLTVPRLPAIPFFDRELTPWIAQLEAAAPDILAEAKAVMTPDMRPAFVPYVANPAGTPLNQWKDLDHSLKWGAYFLWKHGARHDDHCAHCPKTAEVLARLPLARLDGRAPNAFFSLLEPDTKIPAHTGVTNARLTVHLPLIVPEGCGFRVGAETRQWVPGKAWVFDDTIEHEAWNDSDEPRLIMIFDIWHPMLTPDEIRFFDLMLSAYDAHYGKRTGSDVSF